MLGTGSTLHLKITSFVLLRPAAADLVVPRVFLDLAPGAWRNVLCDQAMPNSKECSTAGLAQMITVRWFVPHTPSRPEASLSP